ncbi:hypothetical protein DR864_27305 [Runella rosea]|uniref:Uncharacterized protein n=1 Tax=Runella rosea TaxID=2259595 RepID=A0A344TRB0_9BACT|nr:hypothetical protein [Runella rosea]AXE21181.1 hypothetical protein DR864_27305 [Runella rosea]
MNKNKKSVLEVMFGGLHKKISEALTPEEYTELTHKAATLSQEETLEAVQATTGIGAVAGVGTTAAAQTAAQTATPPAPTTSAAPAPQAAAEAAPTQSADPMQALMGAVQALTQKVDGIATKQATYESYFKTAQNAGVALPGADASSRGQQSLANVAADSPMGVAAEIWKRNNPQG